MEAYSEGDGAGQAASKEDDEPREVQKSGNRPEEEGDGSMEIEEDEAGMAGETGDREVEQESMSDEDEEEGGGIEKKVTAEEYRECFVISCKRMEAHTMKLQEMRDRGKQEEEGPVKQAILEASPEMTWESQRETRKGNAGEHSESAASIKDATHRPEAIHKQEEEEEPVDTDSLLRWIGNVRLRRCDGRPPGQEQKVISISHFLRQTARLQEALEKEAEGARVAAEEGEKLKR